MGRRRSRPQALGWGAIPISRQRGKPAPATAAGARRRSSGRACLPARGPPSSRPIDVPPRRESPGRMRETGRLLSQCGRCPRPAREKQRLPKPPGGQRLRRPGCLPGARCRSAWHRPNWRRGCPRLRLHLERPPRPWRFPGRMPDSRRRRKLLRNPTGTWRPAMDSRPCHLRRCRRKAAGSPPIQRRQRPLRAARRRRNADSAGTRVEARPRRQSGPQRKLSTCLRAWPRRPP
jgi:hypothetical protein